MLTQSAASNTRSMLFDPDLPSAKEVLVAISCVATQYAIRPSLDLAILASDLAYKLTAPEYAETKLIAEIAKRLVSQWNQVVHERKVLEAQLSPISNTLQ